MRMGLIFLESGIEWRLSCFFYGEDLVSCGESEEDLKVMVGHFVEVCKRKCLKVNADKNKVMMLCGEEGSICKIFEDGTRAHVSSL